MFSLRKEKVAPTPPGPRTIFGEVVIPPGTGKVTHEGITILIRGGDWPSVEVHCQRCGVFCGRLQPSPQLSWEKVKEGAAKCCSDCFWFEQRYKEELAGLRGEIKELEMRREFLLKTLAGLPDVKRPKSLRDHHLQEAGLILDRDPGSFLGFILVDYSRKEMRQLVGAVEGRLEPFSRGFKLLLNYKLYKLFPGSYRWDSGYQYLRHEKGSYLDYLHEQVERVEKRAESISQKIASHAACTAA